VKVFPAAQVVRQTTLRWFLPYVVALGALAAWAAIPLFAILSRSRGVFFDGGDGMFGDADQLQYLAWIRDASQHWLASNLFDIRSTPHVFLHPMFVLSAALTHLGLSVQVSYLMWEPLAVAVLFTGTWAYVRQTIGSTAARLAAFLIAVFFFSPFAPLLAWAGLGSQTLRDGVATIATEAFSAGALWGYLPTAIALGLMPLLLLRLGHAPDRGGWRSRSVLLTAAGAALIAWLHPWQGMTLSLMLVGLVLWERRLSPAVLAGLAGATLTLAYYRILPSLSPAWAQTAQPNDFPHVGLWLLSLAPLVPLALFALRPLPVDRQERLLRLWPLAALVVYFALHQSFFYHALEGLALPLGVLTVRGWQRLQLRRLLGVGALAILIAPGLAYALQTFSTTLDRGQDYYVATAEAQALAYLARASRPGGVLTRYYLGRLVPALSGRATWVGNYEWTPDFNQRRREVEALFAAPSPDRLRAALAQSGAAFVLTGCRDSPSVVQAIQPLASSERRFGCARVFEIKAPPS
jgi:hypothetical protein